jgi:hypothetical protein
MDKQTKEQRFRQALADYAAGEVPASRDLWPAMQRRLQQRRRATVLNLTMPMQRPRWSALAAVTAVLLILGLLSYALPATLGNYLPNGNGISPARTYAATLVATSEATTVVRTTTPLPDNPRRSGKADPPLNVQAATSQALPMSLVEPPTPLPQPLSP